MTPVGSARPSEAKENVAGGSAFQLSGTNPFVPFLPAEPIWGSFSKDGEKATGSFRSEVLPAPTLPYVQVLVSGYMPSAQMGIELIPEGSEERIRIQPDRAPREGWQKVVVRAPRSAFRIEARDERVDAWLAFSGFRFLGRYGFYARNCMLLAEWLFCFGLLSPLGLVVCRVFKRQA